MTATNTRTSAGGEAEERDVSFFLMREQIAGTGASGRYLIPLNYVTTPR